MGKVTSIVLLVLFLSISSESSFSQYFGKNKPSYRTFDFKLARTEHFDIYHYLNDTDRLNKFGNLAEQWYRYHRKLLIDTFRTRNPVILYRNHAEFQQTSAILSDIGIGTGGVTESLKRRIVMPFAFSDYQTSHVLGHEMVHAFQYHIFEQYKDLSPASITRVPLWMIEGMAEYLSVGNSDAYTAVWMRDALLSNEFPTLEELSRSGQYSPYRFGQAFWSYIASRYGEQYIRRLFLASAMSGYHTALEDLLGITPDSLSKEWRETLANHLLTRQDSSYTLLGEKLFSKKNAGRYNLYPSVSPDGRHIVVLSERDIYSLDLFLASAHNGEIIDKLYTSSRTSDIDALEYIETSGTWSPDNRHFAFTGYQKGKSVILIFDTVRNKLKRTISPPGIDAVSSPVWSPDGESIAFSGMVNGVSNIYLFDLEEKQVKAVTTSSFASIQPSWTSDGKCIWFSTDEPASDQTMHFPGFFNLARVNLISGKTEVFCPFDGAKNLNPVAIPGQNLVFFLSNVNGRRDLYVFDTTDETIRRATNYATGIMGITEMSPALSLASGSIYYSMLWHGEFQIVKVPYDLLLQHAEVVPRKDFDYRAARLAPFSRQFSVVDQNLIYNGVLDAPKVEIRPEPLKKDFRLDYLGNMAAGVMTSRFGTGMGGSVEALFSDVLGHHLLYTAASIYGEIYDFGGQVALLNQKHRIKTGISFSHIPYRMGYFTYEGAGDEQSLVYYSRRIFEDKTSLFAYMPLTRMMRIESGTSIAHYGYRYEKIEDIRNYYPTYYESGTRTDAPDGFWVGQADVALVFDNAKNGMTSPVDGTRTRVQFEKFYNGVDAHAFLFDYRKYKFIRPFSVAFRLYHYGRYGADSETNRMTRLFAGYPWLVRGYDTGGFYADSTHNTSSIGIKHLIGSRMLVANVEWRMPLSGPIDLALLRSSTFFSEFTFFIDAGLTWDDQSTPYFSLTTTSDKERIPVFSTGTSVRFSFFGLIIIEPYFAFPFHQGRFYTGQFGFNIFPGW